MVSNCEDRAPERSTLAARIKAWGGALGFNRVGIAGVDLAADEARLLRWLDRGFQGEMGWMARHGTKRSRPAELEAETVSVISARMDYWPQEAAEPNAVLADDSLAYVSRYALGRDYHKVMRARLRRLAERIASEVGPFRYRAFSDSAPVLEKPLARNAGLGWIGKHTNLIHREAGSWFFLGELYTDLDLRADEAVRDHCGTCASCIQACPTGAIIAPYVLDARRCISYLTIELHGSIPVHLRPLIGNRVYGCDDCQLVCPWNRFARSSPEIDFAPRNGLDSARLAELFQWTEEEFTLRLQGSAILRIGHERFMRNVAVALGNAATSREVVDALRSRADDGSALVREHVAWALERHGRVRYAS